MGLLGCLGIGIATAQTRYPDVNEAHVLLESVGDLASLVPGGSTVLVECQLPNGNYLAIGPAIGVTVPVVKVAATQLDAPPRGPFAESCGHWQRRHRVSRS